MSISMYTRQKIAATGKAIAIPIAARMESLPSTNRLSVLPETMHARVGPTAAANNARLMDGAFQPWKGWLLPRRGISSRETVHAVRGGSVREPGHVQWGLCQNREARMLHILLLTVVTAGVATLTFALMGLASMLSVACRSSADGRFRVPRLPSDGPRAGTLS
jgi:hypothetical protein